MRLLLVHNRDGRVIAELETHEQALCLLERLSSDDPFALHGRPGSLVASRSSVTIRLLSGS
jgi:hypothetical protein